MPIPESQLQTWSHQGSITQSALTYESIRNTLNHSNSPYYTKSFSIFLQGSYGNDTNVYRESDVDIVICLDQTYYSNTNALTEDAKIKYNKGFSQAPYQYSDFKADVIAWLTKTYGKEVKLGKKPFILKEMGRDEMLTLLCALSTGATGPRAMETIRSLTKAFAFGQSTAQRLIITPISMRKIVQQNTKRHISASNLWYEYTKTCEIA